MDFISNKEPQIEEMLKTIGVKDLSELWACIPKEILEPGIEQDDGLSEFEGIEHIKTLAKENSFSNYCSYLGAGAYEHYIPAIVPFITTKSGFMTAYTPYQAEASQGFLQTIFEFQSTLGRLCGLQVANASLYDGASAAAEALLMMSRIQPDRSKVLVAENLHPHYLNVIEQYVLAAGLEIVKIPLTADKKIDANAFKELCNEQVAGVLLGYPNFYGVVEEVKPLIDIAHQHSILCGLCSHPLVFALYQSAGDLDVDIVVGDLQPLGMSLQLGGPYCGYLACKKQFVRQLPGRLVGKTQDKEGNKGFVLTLQTREQHIRREKATSNICSNQALCALASLVTILWYGPNGLYELALANFQKTQYLKEKLSNMNKVRLFQTGAHLNEFAIEVDTPLENVFDAFRQEGIEPGVALSKWFPDLQKHLLIAVTETKNEEQLDHYLRVAEKLWN